MKSSVLLLVSFCCFDSFCFSLQRSISVLNTLFLLSNRFKAQFIANKITLKDCKKTKNETTSGINTNQFSEKIFVCLPKKKIVTRANYQWKQQPNGTHEIGQNNRNDGYRDDWLNSTWIGTNEECFRGDGVQGRERERALEAGKGHREPVGCEKKRDREREREH